MVYKYRVTLTREHPHANLEKALRHLKTNLHWTRGLFAVREIDGNTLAADGDYPDVVMDIKQFSHYYPHIFFTLTLPTQLGGTTLTFLNSEQASEER